MSTRVHIRYIDTRGIYIHLTVHCIDSGHTGARAQCALGEGYTSYSIITYTVKLLSTSESCQLWEDQRSTSLVLGFCSDWRKTTHEISYGATHGLRWFSHNVPGPGSSSPSPASSEGGREGGEGVPRS